MITLDFDRMNDEQAELASQAMDQGYSQEEIADLLEALDRGDEDAETPVYRIWAVSVERDTERRGHIYMNAAD